MHTPHAHRHMYRAMHNGWFGRNNKNINKKRRLQPPTPAGNESPPAPPPLLGHLRVEEIRPQHRLGPGGAPHRVAGKIAADKRVEVAGRQQEATDRLGLARPFRDHVVVVAGGALVAGREKDRASRRRFVESIPRDLGRG